MNQLIINLPNDYKIPEYIKNITSIEWVKLFNQISISANLDIQNNKSVYNCPVEQKGFLGEERIIDLLGNYFRDAIIKNVSNSTSCGDIFFIWKKIRCLVEVKNKKVITSDDIAKFIRDVNHNIEQNNDINSAIFISLCTDKFPNKTKEHIQIEIINNIPVIFFYLDHDKSIYYPILTLNHIINNTNQLQISTKKLLTQNKILYENTIKQMEFINKLIISKEKELKSLHKQVKLLKDILDNNNFDYDLSNYITSDNVSAINNFIKNNNRNPKRNELIELGISKNTLAQISKIAPKKVLNTILTFCVV